MSKNRSKNIFSTLNTPINDTVKGSAIRSRKFAINEESGINESTIVDFNSSSKTKSTKKTPTRRRTLMSCETDDLDSETFLSFPNQDINQSIPSGNRTRNTPMADDSHAKPSEFIKEMPRLKNTRNLILDDNDLVIIQTPIKANQLKLDKTICLSCSHQLNKVFHDLKLYSITLQSLIMMFIFGIIAINFYLVYRNCGEIDSKNEYFCLKKCNISIMTFSLMIICALTGPIFYYDNYQFEHGGYRPKSFFLMFLIWSGGWIVVWPIFLYLKNQTFNDYKISTFIVSLLSVTGPAFYLVINSLF
jgi:hypothetical protein